MENKYEPTETDVGVGREERVAVRGWAEERKRK